MSGGRNHPERNGYMLKGALAKRGYDWWWHSLVGISTTTGKPQPFFIEYFVIGRKAAQRAVEWGTCIGAIDTV